MISSVTGLVDSVGADYIIIETGGIGYRIFMPKAELYRFAKGQTVKVYTYLQVKEDGLSLYGFAEPEELDMFVSLTGVPGVGPKAAVSVLSSLTPKEVINAVASGDAARLAKAQGIGSKTAQMICLKLKDKLASQVFTAEFAETNQSGEQSQKTDAADALAALGYSRSDALSAVLQVALPDMSVQDIIKAALKKLSNK